MLPASLRPHPFLVLLPWVALAPSNLAAQEPPLNSRPSDQARTAQIQQILTETQVDTRQFEPEMTLAQFLTALEGCLPEGKKVALGIDEAAFGKQLPQVAGAIIRCPRLQRESVAWILRRVLSGVKDVEVDFSIRPAGVVITRPQLAAFSMTYDVADVVPQMHQILEDGPPQPAELFQDLQATDGVGLLVRSLLNEVKFQPWETVEVQNGTRLIVLASPTRQEETADFLTWLGRFTEVAVVMNARLYEVDRDFYCRKVAPLFAAHSDSRERQPVVAIEAPLLQAITRQKLLLESEDRKLRPHQQALFLAQQTVFRFALGPPPEKKGQPPVSTGLAGVSFEVCPLVSPDRRYLRLHLAQKVVQLVGMEKVKTLEPATGKELEVESPNLRRTEIQGTIQILDGKPILMPVDYRLAGKGTEDRVWLLVARPFIWIDEEVKHLRKEGKDLSSKSVWESEVPQEEKVVPTTRLPASGKVKEILQAIVTDVLTNPDLASTREFYGTKEDRTVTLEDSDQLGWPPGFRPATGDYRLVEVRHDPFVQQRRILGIRLDKFDLSQKKGDLSNPIEVCIFNAGGSANGGVIGGCSVGYVPKHVGSRWHVRGLSILDP